MLETIRNFFNSPIFRMFIVVLTVLVLFSISGSIYMMMQDERPDPITVMLMLIAAVIVLLFLGVFIVSNRVSATFSFVKRGRRRTSRLRKRVIIAFSIGAVLPAITVAMFSIYFFNISVQTWFDSKISKVLDQSVNVGNSYVSEHVMQLRETSLSIADDLNAMYYDLIHNQALFNKVLSAQAEMRSLNEAIIFQKSTNIILARTKLSFSLTFANIPAHLMQRADKGEIVRIPSDRSKIRMLIKLRDYNDTYLLMGRLIDVNIIDYISSTEGAVAEYNRLKSNIDDTQIKFSFIFISFAALVIIAAVKGGRNFAERLVRPIRQLVIAAEKVKNGDFTARVPEKNLKKDEIKVLASAFNRMITQIERQQKELLVAQKALAWSDVARQVAHEIKNPLTPIQLSANRLSSKFADQVEDKEAFEKYIDNILRKSNDIKKIVSEFVNFARMPAPNFAACEVVSYMNDLIDSRKLIREDIRYQFKSNVSEFAFACDLTQFNQIIENLLQNAEDALKDIRSPQIKVEIHKQDTSLSISFADNGIGIPDDKLDDVKKAYFTLKEQGTGLGLAIVERIVQDHFGEMHVVNNEKGGATIRLSFNTQLLKGKMK